MKKMFWSAVAITALAFVACSDDNSSSASGSESSQTDEDEEGPCQGGSCQVQAECYPRQADALCVKNQEVGQVKVSTFINERLVSTRRF